MTERELWGYFGKRVRVTCTTGEVVEGIAAYFTKAIDNEPEVASIGIPQSYGGIIDITADEIKSIEVLAGS